MTWEMEMKVRVLKHMQNSDSGIQRVLKIGFHNRRLGKVGRPFLLLLLGVCSFLPPYYFLRILSPVFLLICILLLSSSAYASSPISSSCLTQLSIGPLLMWSIQFSYSFCLTHTHTHTHTHTQIYKICLPILSSILLFLLFLQLFLQSQGWFQSSILRLTKLFLPSTFIYSYKILEQDLFPF